MSLRTSLIFIGNFFLCVGLGGLMMYALDHYFPAYGGWAEIVRNLVIGAGIGIGIYRFCVKPALLTPKV